MNKIRRNRRAEERQDVPGANEEKQKILPRSTNKKPKKTRKMRLELEKTHLISETTKRENHINDRSNNNGDHTAIPMEDEPPDSFQQRPKFFGVRNYLHNFYETVAIKNPQMYEDISEPSSPPPPKERSCRCQRAWKAGLAAALVVLTAGLILLLVGFVSPLQPSVAEQSEEFLVIDRTATAFNEAMRACRLAGVALFVFGFGLFLCVVLGALCWNLSHDGPPDDDEEESLPVGLAAQTIPATEELSAVQPRRDAAEGMVTKAGLCVPPKPRAN